MDRVSSHSSEIVIHGVLEKKLNLVFYYTQWYYSKHPIWSISKANWAPQDTANKSKINLHAITQIIAII